MFIFRQKNKNRTNCLWQNFMILLRKDDIVYGKGSNIKAELCSQIDDIVRILSEETIQTAKTR